MSNPNPFIPDNAPFNSEQRSWLNGFFAGYLKQGSSGKKDPKTIKSIHIYFDTQTNTAEALANKITLCLSKYKITCQLNSISDLSVEKLNKLEALVVIISNYGDVKAPDSTKTFLAELTKSQTKLPDLYFAICALGDSNYPNFCQSGKIIDENFLRLGAHSLAARAECDLDYEENFSSFLKSLQNELIAMENEEIISPEISHQIKHSIKLPYVTKMIKKYSLAKGNSKKDTWHIELDLSAEHFSFEAGDAIGVFPENDIKTVTTICKNLRLKLTEPVSLNKSSRLELQSALIKHCNIQQLPESLFTLIIKANNPTIEDLNIQDSYEKIKSLDLEDLSETISCKITAQELIDNLKPISPRLYNISSSPLATPNSIHLTVGVLEYEDQGKQKKGVCSNYLKNLDLSEKLLIYLHKNTAFKLPPADQNIIMIGPGTGIAPFRGFLQERELSKSTGQAWLLFGNPHRDKDFYYQDEIEGFVKRGFLHKLSTAFSRDQKQKIYVQHKLIEEKETFFEWIENGAYIYVCGDAKKMAKDVHKTIKNIISEFENISDIEAEKYLTNLIQTKRYLRDVY